MEKIYLDDNIWLIKNFISQDELDIITAACENENNWQADDGVGYWKGNRFEVSNSDDNSLDKYLGQLLWDICNRVHDVFDTEDVVVDTNLTILRFQSDPKEGVAMTPHHDMSTKYTTHGLVLYYNDNFEGGNLEYIRKGISIKPEAGMLVCHPASAPYTHQVSTLFSGTRYMSTFFAYEKEFFTLNNEERKNAFDSFDREQEY